ncbi:DNA primase-like protein [Halorubrum californiense DSM 19288]|uniref:DNA primase-like protein n=1 Tax=Halorubrum californiense DSM 19288 TaxID=1227465 RepID=M0DZ32_9EURY|nr:MULTISPECIES: DNA primase-like protein [Halorubrum]ELZ40766.1 DNA primase-like protein [Halorubrum californiense DSM 19288]TKX72955.1 DNA primase [Halorubrum sp. GN11GM_10-3_MGM]
MTWRQATREEIYAYYVKEFPRYIGDLPEFITADGPKQYAVGFRDPHPVRKDEVPDKDFIRRDTWQTNRSGERTTPEFDDFEDVVEFIRHPAKNDPLGRSEFALADPEVLEQPDPRPDAVYYALDHWERPWVLLVDIDAKEIARDRADELVSASVDDRDDDALLNDAEILDAPPEGYPYAFEDVDRAIEYGFEVRDIFEDDFDAEETMVVYSGQGVHVYLLDTDPAHRYDEQSREVLNDLLLETYDIPIDPVVTADRRRVARLPYSLHADVCSIVQPIESPAFDVRSATPEVIDE